jgi:hypothetical protein
MTAGGPPGSEDEALGIIEAGEAIGVPTVTLLLQGLGMTLAQPRGVARETRRLAADTVRILAGKSDRVPAKGDRRSPIRPGRRTRRSGGCARST